jgi:RNA polymerase primary sigma factor
MTLSACICARWGPFLCLPAKAKLKSQKAIERGQNRVLKALSRSPIVIRELLALGEDLEKGVRSIKELVTFDEEEITEEIVEKRLKEFLAKINTLDKLYKKVAPLQEKLAAVNLKKNARMHRRYRFSWRMQSCTLRLQFESWASPTTNASA